LFFNDLSNCAYSEERILEPSVLVAISNLRYHRCPLITKDNALSDIPNLWVPLALLGLIVIAAVFFQSGKIVVPLSISNEYSAGRLNPPPRPSIVPALPIRPYQRSRLRFPPLVASSTSQRGEGMVVSSHGSWFKALAARNQSWQDYLITQIR